MRNWFQELKSNSSTTVQCLHLHTECCTCRKFSQRNLPSHCVPMEVFIGFLLLVSFTTLLARELVAILWRGTHTKQVTKVHVSCQTEGPPVSDLFSKETVFVTMHGKCYHGSQACRHVAGQSSLKRYSPCKTCLGWSMGVGPSWKDHLSLQRQLLFTALEGKILMPV